MPELPIPAKLLVIAQSARMLAQMAVSADFIPLAVDCFADEDTRQLSLDTRKVASLSLKDVRPAVEALRQAHSLTHVVYGSGFEQFTQTLAYLEQYWVVLGNPLAVFKQMQDKRAFFKRLAVLAIPYPETVFAPPVDSGWLFKPMQGEGGINICVYEPGSDIRLAKGYWQRQLQGQAMSLTFVASNGQLKLLGFNRQWQVAIDNCQRFVFAGIGNYAEISLANQRLLAAWLASLLRVYPLQGLGSLDFMLVDGYCYVLEMNARIPASAQLYGKTAFIRHVRAYLGGLGDSEAERVAPAAYRIVFAKRPSIIAERISWPDWVVDRPAGGAIISQGQPICSIIARGDNTRQVSELLHHRLRFIENILNIGS